MINDYVLAKFENKKPTYGLDDEKILHKIWDICKDTYGLLIYQETLMKMFVEFADFSEIESDDARKATAKKNADVLNSLKEKFISRAVLKGYSQESLEKLFELFQSFSSYSFNASHSCSYSFLTISTTWLSSNYPLEFYTAALTLSDNTDDIRKYISGAKERNINISPPNVNKSESEFSIFENDIVFGLSAIKGVGKSITNKIISNRPKSGYTSIGHFIKRNLSIINKKILESYIKAGVFIDFGYTKNTLLSNVEFILEFLSNLKSSDYYTLFDIMNIDFEEFINNNIFISDTEDDPYYEYEAIGLYINEHPLNDYIINTNIVTTIKDILDINISEGEVHRVKVVGVISGINIRKTKSKMNMADFFISDTVSNIDVIVFPKVYSEYMNEIQEGRIAIFEGIVKYENDKKCFYPNNIKLCDSSNPALKKIIKSKPIDIQKEVVYKNKPSKIVHKVNDQLTFIFVEKA